jgi:hypothetical protein
MQQDGFTIREVSHNFTATPTVNDDITKGFVIGSRWILDNGDVYVCSDETASAAVWALQVASVPTLQQVTDEGSITTNVITVGDTAGIYSEVADSYVGTANEANDTYAYLSNDGSLGLGNGTHESNLKNTNATTTGIILEFPNKAVGSYTIATTDEITNGTVTSVGLTMPSAFTVANSPITSNGDIAVTGAGLVSQYVRGDGSLANFPASTGGGASQSFYLNGSVSQGTFGGIAFKEMDRVPILGAGTDFTINTNGYIQSFITDANVPNLLEIPAGNWNFETYFSASSGGGSPSFYLELYKWNGTTLSLIASNSATPEGITNGTVTDLYISALAVPQTALLATDRLAVRIYVNNSGRTIKLHTENNHLCQVITTFSTGITALNGLTDQVQNFAVGTSGTDFAINSATGTHTFNLPTASAANRGALSSADWSTFDGKQNALGFTPENVANKATTFATVNDTLYPTVKAVNDQLALIPFNPSKVSYYDDFIGFVLNQTANLSSTSNSAFIVIGGTPRISTMSASFSDARGVLQCETQASTTSNALVGAFDMGLRCGSGVINYTSRVRIETLSDGTNRYDIFSGIANRSSFLNQPIVFRYSDNVNSGKWQIVTQGATADSGIVVNVNQWYILRIVVNAAGTSAEFFIDGVSVGTLGSLPLSSVVLGAMYGFRKSLGATNRNTYVDYQLASQDLNFTR